MVGTALQSRPLVTDATRDRGSGEPKVRVQILLFIEGKEYEAPSLAFEAFGKVTDEDWVSGHELIYYVQI